MKRYALVFTPRAERQLAELYTYVADQGGETRAETYVGKIIAWCRGLSTFPLRGTTRDDIHPNLRTIAHARRVTIAFSVNVATKTVVIHGVFHGGQDFASSLQDTEGDA